MEEATKKALNVLIGLPLRCIGRAANLLWMHFGEWHEIPNRRGGTRTVGDWAVHIQCNWRFARGPHLLLGHQDMYDAAEGDDYYDWMGNGDSKFDRLAGSLNASLESDVCRVGTIVCDELGGFRLTFEDGLIFELFPAASPAPGSYEFWRLFQPHNETGHFVVDNEGGP